MLVVAGLHVGAIAAVLFWLGRKLRLARSLAMLFTLMLLFSYVTVVEERPPVLRAAAMTAIVVLGGFFFRRLELLNSGAIAALILLIAKPLALRDSSFQLTFVAIGCIPGPPLWLIVLFFAIGVALATRLRSKHTHQKSQSWGVCLAWFASALAIAIFPFKPRWAAGKLEVSVLDVGQGDSLFVVSPGGKTMLIDGGGAFGGFTSREEVFGIDPGEEAVSPYLWSRGFQKLDVVALTHAHQDHLGALTAVLENFRLGQLWIGREVSSAALVRLEQIARDRNIPIEHELRGKSFDWDGVEGDFLRPEASPENIGDSAKNNDSLVLRFGYGTRTFLLPGDAERAAEHEILAENRPETLRSDVLKIGHHGGKNSTNQDFLDAVQPQIGIISVGQANPYGHPSPELLKRLQVAGVRILRTDR